MATRRQRERGKRHSPEQIVRKLREADAMLSAGKSVGGVLQQLGVSEPTYHRWRNQYGGMKAEEAKRLKQREQENARLTPNGEYVTWLTTVPLLLITSRVVF